MLNGETKPKFLCLLYTKQKKNLPKKSFLRESESESGGLNKKQKDVFLTALATMIKKNATPLIRKRANELKFHEDSY